MSWTLFRTIKIIEWILNLFFWKVLVFRKFLVVVLCFLLARVSEKGVNVKYSNFFIIWHWEIKMNQVDEAKYFSDVKIHTDRYYNIMNLKHQIFLKLMRLGLGYTSFQVSSRWRNNSYSILNTTLKFLYIFIRCSFQAREKSIRHGWFRSLWYYDRFEK